MIKEKQGLMHGAVKPLFYQWLTIFALAIITLPLSSAAYAACGAPVGAPGEIIFNSTHRVMQYCDDTNWIAMAPPDNVTALTTGGGKTPPTTSGLVTHLSFSESGSATVALDSTDNLNHVNLFNGAQIQPRKGKIGGGLAFLKDDNAEEVAKFVNTAALRNPLPVTVAFWIKAARIDVEQNVFQSEDSCDENGLDSGYNVHVTAAGKIRGGFGYNAGCSSWSWPSDARDSATTLVPGQWYHVAIVYDDGVDGTNGDETIDIYINGSLDNGTAVNGNAASVVYNNVYDGKIGGASKDSFHGIIDDLRVYNRDLSAGEISDIYEYGSEACGEDVMGKLFYNFDSHVLQYCNGIEWVSAGPVRGNTRSGLVMHWKLDEAAGTDVADVTGNTNGTTVGGPTWVPAGGVINGALDFSANQRVTINTPAAVKKKPPMSYSAWIYLDALPVHADYSAPLIIGNDQWCNGTSSYGGLAMQINSSGRIRIQAAPENGCNGGNLRESTQILNTGQWYHVVGVIHPTANDQKIYINGVDVSGATSGNLQYMGYSPAGVGYAGAHANNNGDLDGKLDDIRIFDRALTLADVTRLYQNGLNGVEYPGCINPAGIEGEIVYNADNNVLQYCNAEQWLAVGK